MHCHFYWLTISFHSHYITMSFLKGKGIVLLLQIKKLFTDNYYCLWSTSWVLDLFIHHLWCMKHQQSSTFIARSDQIRSVTQSCPTLRPHEPQHARPPCPSLTPGVYPNSLSRWYHLTISSSVVSFSSCPQSFPTSGSFQMSQLFASGGKSFGVSASTLVLPMNTQDWSPLEWTGWISLQSKGLSRVFSNTTVQKHQFFSAQLSL